AFGYRRVNVPPDGDFHPAVWTPSQAHERGIYAASMSGCPRARVFSGAETYRSLMRHKCRAPLAFTEALRIGHRFLFPFALQFGKLPPITALMQEHERNLEVPFYASSIAVCSSK